MTKFHSKYYAHDLSRVGGKGVDRLGHALFEACVDLNPHQIEAALFALKSPLSKGVLLADEVGLGKTIEAGLVICQYWAEKKRKILIICPASLRKQWAIELEEKFNLPIQILDTKTYNDLVNSGTPEPFDTSHIIICSMHFVANKFTDIKAIPWHLVVIDEAHKLRNAYKENNRIGQTIRQATLNRKKLLLTATPLQNTLFELYGLATLIDENIFGDLPSFRTQYVNHGGDISGLRDRLQAFCWRTLRRQVSEYVLYTERKLITRPFKPTEEGLPGNERRRVFTVPLNVTYDFGKKLQIIRPKRKTDDGKEYDFKKDGPIPTLGQLTKHLQLRPVKSDWYPRIQTIQSKKTAFAVEKDDVKLLEKHISFLNFDALYFELERFKRERSWHNLNIDKAGIQKLLADNTWYTLFLPKARLEISSFDDVFLLQQIATELLKGFCVHYYNYCKRSFIEPRLELRELTREDENIPQEEYYQLIVNGDEEQVIASIKKIQQELEQNKQLLTIGDLHACRLGVHLFQPLFHLRKGSKITILPVALEESEFQFVMDLKKWVEGNHSKLEQEGIELFLLRNLSRGKGVGFFEASNFHPDFILWMIANEKQYVTFIEPHGLLHEGPGSDKIQFYQRIKEIEQRFANPDIVLNSFILSWTKYPQLQWEETQDELEANHVLFMTDDRNHYIDKLFCALKDFL